MSLSLNVMGLARLIIVILLDLKEIPSFIEQLTEQKMFNLAKKGDEC